MSFTTHNTIWDTAPCPTCIITAPSDNRESAFAASWGMISSPLSKVTRLFSFLHIPAYFPAISVSLQLCFADATGDQVIVVGGFRFYLVS